MRFTPKDNPELLTPLEYDEIRSLTARIHQQLSAGTLDSPSWKLIRTAKLATRIYAPLGTEMLTWSLQAPTCTVTIQFTLTIGIALAHMACSC